MWLYSFVAVTLAVVGGYLLYRRTASECERKGTARRAPRPPSQPVRSRSSPSIKGPSLIQQPPPIPPAKDAPEPFVQEQESSIGEAPARESQPPEAIGGQIASLIEPPASLDPELPSPPVEPENIQPERPDTWSANQGASGPSVERSLTDTNEETPTELGPSEVENNPLMEPAPPADPPALQGSRTLDEPISEEGEFQSQSDITEVSETAGLEDQTAITDDQTADEDSDLGVQEAPLQDQPPVPQVEDGTSAERRTRIDPIRRGGRPRVKEERPSAAEAGDRAAIQLRPDLICWKKGPTWQIGVAGEGENLRVTQGDRELVPEVSGRIPVNDLETGVEVQYSGRTRSFPLLSEKDYLLFKMRKNWSDPGRVVSQLSSGYYVIMAAGTWERDEELSGTPPIQPETVQTTSCIRAHFFHLDASDNLPVALVGEEGSDPIRIHSKGQQFQLVGQQINDSSQSVGPLFGKEPPKIEAVSPEDWESVLTVVCGQEGARIGGWRTQFTPIRGQQTQAMPGQLAKTSGWYFVRVYNQDEDLVESFDFRFCRTLADIRRNVPFLPGPSGHGDVTVECEHEPGLSLFLDNRKLRGRVRIEAGDKATVLHIPPIPDCDETKWTLRDEGNDVSAVLKLPRLWWGVDASKPRQWLDRPTVLSAEAFKATSKQKLWIKALGEHLDSVDIGFHPKSIRSYPAKKSGDTSIPLRDFADAEELEETSGETVLSLYLLTDVCNLLTVRTPWRVHSLEIVQDNEREDTILKLHWKETGEAIDKEIRIIRASDDPDHEPFVLQVSEDDREALITARTGKLPLGECLIEFVGKQRLGDSIELVVGLEDKFSILPPEELLQHAHITIESLHSQYLDHKFDSYTYTIDVVGRIIHGRAPREADLEGTLVKEINDGWYIGHLEVRSRNYDLTEDLVQNPVKFEYLVSRNRITAIEDHDGDGAVFCPECKWIVWSQRWQEAEERRQHKKKLITDFELDICAEQRLEH
ncbi:hypothetical protein MYX82_07105 [Acidobacteria bacterium AH-259-D05]|nr:hypothetical protein [Acidobacteria bacterium AH-259-D05]